MTPSMKHNGHVRPGMAAFATTPTPSVVATTAPIPNGTITAALGRKSFHDVV